jgi:hypothetical protein
LHDYACAIDIDAALPLRRAMLISRYSALMMPRSLPERALRRHFAIIFRVTPFY